MTERLGSESARIAMVQPITMFGVENRDRNVETAERYVEAASRLDVDLVCFPESFPGLWRKPVTWTPLAALQAMAARYAVHIVAGFADPVDEEGERCHNVLALIAPDGAEFGRYQRTTPLHGSWIYNGGPYWDFDWVRGREFPVFNTVFGTVGMAMCSELYVPEVSRALALRGAELILLPAGLASPTSRLYNNWRVLMQARAAENLAYTATCSNISDEGGSGLAMVCSPERVVLESNDDGIHVADLDFGRVRWLRAQQDRLIDGGTAWPWATKPGLLREWISRELVEDAYAPLLEAE